MIPKAGSFKRLLKAFLVGVSASLGRISPQTPSAPPPIEEEWQNLERSEADCRVRTIGSVRYTYGGPMMRLDQAGILAGNPTLPESAAWGLWWKRSWKTVLDRDLRNRCVEGTGVEPET